MSGGQNQLVIARKLQAVFASLVVDDELIAAAEEARAGNAPRFMLPVIHLGSGPGQLSRLLHGLMIMILIKLCQRPKHWFSGPSAMPFA